MYPRMRSIVAGTIGVIATIFVWWLLVASGTVDDRILPGPFQLVSRAMTLDGGEVALHLGTSLQRVIAGGLVGGILGLIFGILIGWNDRLRAVLNLPLELLRPIPPLAWIPLAIIWFGTGNGSKVFVIGLGCFFVMLTNTEKGIRELNRALIRQGRSYGLSGFSLIRHVVFPGIRPEIMVGASISTSLAFASLVAAEILGADAGLGYLLMRGRMDGDFAIMFIAIGLIAGLAYVVDLLARKLIVPHRDAYDL